MAEKVPFGSATKSDLSNQEVINELIETDKRLDNESLIENPRAAIESAIILENETPEVHPEEPTESKPKDESLEQKPESDENTDPIARIKASVQKRIDKVVAKQKSAEERLAEAEAELARLRANPQVTAEKKTDDAPPTIEQVEAYIVKMAEEGNKKEEIAATRYLIKLEKEAAIREVEERQANIKKEAEARATRENQALLDLAKDYIIYDDKGHVDMKADMTLANQKGKLFETAMALYNDPELHKLYYNDPDRAMGLRRAVQDANRELHAQGLVSTPKADGIETRRVTRQVLADPEAVEAEDTPTPPSNLLSDADKVREEIKQRNRLRNSRIPSRQ